MHPYLASGLVWLIALTSIGSFELYATLHHQPTLSQWAWHFERQHSILRWVFPGVTAFLAYHFWSKG